MDLQTLRGLPIVLALEPVSGQSPPALTMHRDEAAELAALVAADLQILLPGVDEARLALAGAWFDQVELLRPGFPVWAVLDELARRVPRGQLDNVVAFGSHDGRMPAPALQPAAEFAAGPMRLLPLTLLVPEGAADALSEQIELQLVGRGEAGTRTADWLMRQLGIKLEHVRYLSRNDLLALTCVQYEHVNLATLWALLEAALLTPQREQTGLSARGLSLHYANGAVWAQPPAQWLAGQTGDHAARAHAFAGIVFELRQYASLLAAHQLPLRLVGGTDEATDYLLETLADAEPGRGAPWLYGHQAAGLGVIAVSVIQAGDAAPRVLAHGYPLRAEGLAGLLAALAARYGTEQVLHNRAPLALDADGALTGVAAAT